MKTAIDLMKLLAQGEEDVRLGRTSEQDELFIRLKKKLGTKKKSMKKVMENIFTVNLGVKDWERVLVFTDLIRDEEKVSDDERKRREALRRIAGDAEFVDDLRGKIWKTPSLAT